MGMESSLVNSTLETLKKYVVFFKTTLQEENKYLLLGLSGDCLLSTLPCLLSINELPEQGEVHTIDDDCLLIKIPGQFHRYQLWLPSNKLRTWWPKLTQSLRPTTESFWKLMDIESVTPVLSEPLVDKYIPQHLNQPSLGGVSFKKGCYTGQEIITRMQNLGQQKSRCYHLSLQKLELNASLIHHKLYDQNGKSIGEIIMTATNPYQHRIELLAVIRIVAAESNQVYFDNQATQALSVHPIPYTIDEKAELQH